MPGSVSTPQTHSPTAPLTPDVRPAPPASPLLRAMTGLQHWLLGLRREGRAHTVDTMVVDIDEHASKRFCLGVSGGRVFLGVQAIELEWFGHLPWLHCAVRKGGSTISLVSEGTVSGNAEIPCFAISLHAGGADRVALLTRCPYLDVREITVGKSGAAIGVSRRVLTTIDVVLTKDDSTLEGLMAGRTPSGFTNHSAFRK